MSGEDQDMENCPLCYERDDDTTKHVIFLCEEIDINGIYLIQGSHSGQLWKMRWKDGKKEMNTFL